MVLVALLLVVPLQLLFSRYVTQSLVEEEEEALDIQGIRADAVTRQDLEYHYTVENGPLL